MTAQISTIAIITCDRLPGLVRALESYIANVKKYGRQVEFAIFDDSRDPTAREATRATLRELKKKHSVIIHYAGREEKLAFAAILQKESGVLRSVIDFALFDPFEIGYSVGANRNATLLHTAGEMFYSADDDTICEFFAMANYRPDFAVAFQPNPTELYFYRDAQSAQGSAFRTEKNLLEMVEDMLGQCPKDLISASKLPLDAKLATPDYASKITSDGHRVLVNWVGIFGDSGYVYPGFMLWLSGESRRRLLRDSEFYAAIKQSRQILRAPLKRTLGPGPFCQTTAIGFDNRELLPPFLPVFRGEDFAFGSLLRHRWAGAVFGYLPWAIRHEPLVARMNKPDDILIPAGRANFFPILTNWIEASPRNPSHSDKQSLADFGRHLVDLASDPADLTALIRQSIEKQRQKSLEMHQKILELHKNQPEYWANDIRTHQAAVEAAPQRSEYYIPKELWGHQDSQEVCQRLVRALGGLYEQWPTIFSGALQLRARGETLARPIE